MEIIYIHGYGSSGESDSAKSLRKSFPELISPTYDPLDPEKSLKHLESFIKKDERVIIIASSLGGWYAERLSEKFKNVELYLYNPSTHPETSLKKYGIDSKITDKYTYMEKHPGHSVATPVTLFLAIDDKVVPYRTARSHYIQKYTDGEVDLTTIMVDGGHRMGNNYTKVVKAIKKKI